MPQHTNTLSSKIEELKYVVLPKLKDRNTQPETNCLLNRTNEANACSLPEANNAKTKPALQRMKDFMADPGPAPFRHETIVEAQRRMADKIREFEQQFGK